MAVLNVGEAEAVFRVVTAGAAEGPPDPDKANMA
jgi:hypothetical protein